MTQAIAIKKEDLVTAIETGNATSGLGVRKADVERDIYDVLINEVSMKEVVLSTSRENLSLVPATIQLAGAEVELTTLMARESRLKSALKEVRDDYDYILIDCPPSLEHKPQPAHLFHSGCESF